MGRAFQILLSESFGAVLLKNSVYRRHPLLEKEKQTLCWKIGLVSSLAAVVKLILLQ